MNSIRAIVGLKSGPVGAAKAAVDTLGHGDNPDYLLPRAMNELGKLQGVGRQFVNPVTRAPFGALPAIGETTNTEFNPTLGEQAPGGPSTPGQVINEGESVMQQQRDNEVQGVPGRLARIQGRSYQVLNPIAAGTATPDVVIRSNQPASRLPGLDRIAAARGKFSAILNDPAATASEKAIAKGLIEKVDAALDIFSRGTPHPNELQPGFVRIQDSAGAVHDIPEQALGAAIQRDPKIRVISTGQIGGSVKQ